MEVLFWVSFIVCIISLTIGAIMTGMVYADKHQTGDYDPHLIARATIPAFIAIVSLVIVNLLD